MKVVARLQDADVILGGEDRQATHLLDPLPLKVDGAQDVLPGEELVVKVSGRERDVEERVAVSCYLRQDGKLPYFFRPTKQPGEPLGLLL